MTLQLEHPEVLKARRKLEGHLSRGEIRRYTNLHWTARDGVIYSYQPSAPVNFVKYTFALEAKR